MDDRESIREFIKQNKIKDIIQLRVESIKLNSPPAWMFFIELLKKIL